MPIMNQSGCGGYLPLIRALPKEWLFIQNDSWTAPRTGSYKVTVVGRGGNGADDLDKPHGGGGGSGGWCEKTMTIEKGTTYAITVSTALSSFGSVMSTTAGGNATGKVVGVGGVATGGTVNNNGNTGSVGQDVVTNNGTAYRLGGYGGAIKNHSNSKYLSDPPQTRGAYYVLDYSDNPSVQGLTGLVVGSLYLPFGTGGVGGYSTESEHSNGITGMVAIELIIE